MEKITLNGKEIIIRKLAVKDLKIAQKHLDFYNSLLDESLYITSFKKLSLKQEKEYLKGKLKKQKQGKCIYLVSECDGEFASHVEVHLMEGKQDHIGILGFAHREGFRGIGLGSVLGRIMTEMVLSAAKELSPKPRIIQAGIYAENKASLGLAEKFGFKEVAIIPKQFQYDGKLMDEIIVQLYL